MNELNWKKKQQIAKKAARIRELSEDIAKLIDDDPMHGEIFESMNRIASDADNIMQAVK
jgi:hypothetical protein